MRVFLTGATGFVGKYVINELLEKDHEVHVFCRSGSEAKLQRPNNVTIHYGNMGDPASLKEGCKGCDAVINLVGIIKEFPKKGITFEAAHVSAAKNISEAAKSASVKRFIQMSALGTGPDSVSAYHKTKFEAEKILIDSGFDLTIFRPSLIFAEEGEFLNMLKSLVKLPLTPVIGNGKVLFQPIYAGDVAKAFVKSLEMKISIGKTYELGGLEKLSFDQLLDKTGESLNNRAIKIHIPAAPVKFFVKLLDRFSFIPVTYDQLQMLEVDNICNENEFLDDFSIKPVLFPGT